MGMDSLFFDEEHKTMIRFTPPVGPLMARPVAMKEFPEVYFWTWINANWIDEGKSPASGWKFIENTNQDDFLLVCSHLNLVLEQRNLSGKTGKYFAHQDDLRFAFECPVLLAYQAPATTPPELPEDITVGTHGIVLTPSPVCYTIDQLGDLGQELFTHIRQGTLLLPQRESLQPVRWDQNRQAIRMQLHDTYWAQAQISARQLASLYWQYHQQHLPIPPMSIPNVLQAGQAPLVAPLAVQGVLGAYSNAQSGAKGWGKPTEKPGYHFMQGKDVARIEFRPPQAPVNAIVPAELALQSLWQQVQKFSDLDGDVFLALLAQWTSAPREEDGSVWISSEQILNYRGIQPRQHENSDGSLQTTDHRLDDLQSIASSIERIRDTHVTTQQWIKEERAPGKRGRPKKRLLELESYIVMIAEYIRQRDLPSSEDATEEGLAIAWRIKPGTTLEMFFEEPNRQVAWLLEKTLSYDYYHELWEKRLARYCTFHMRMNPGHGGVSITRRIEDIFEELSLPRNSSDPEKTRRRFEKALDRLLQDKQISAWKYQEDIDALPSRKWLPVWLNYSVQMETDLLLSTKDLPSQTSEKEDLTK